jgi:hypothetical protein
LCQRGRYCQQTNASGKKSAFHIFLQCQEVS